MLPFKRNFHSSLRLYLNVLPLKKGGVAGENTKKCKNGLSLMPEFIKHLSLKYIIMQLKRLFHIRFRKRISDWWSKRGNRGLHRWYFEASLTFIIGYSILSSFTVITHAATKSILDLALAENFQITTSILDISFYLTLAVGSIVIPYVALAYMRKRTGYTFKTKPKLRVTILKRKSWSNLFFGHFFFY